eukprot:UN09342
MSSFQMKFQRIPSISSNHLSIKFVSKVSFQKIKKSSFER